MSSLKETHYIIAYDISDKKRLRKVHQLVEEYAVKVQRSVFSAPFTAVLLKELVQRLKNIINIKQDDIRIYPLSVKHSAEIYGICNLPEGLICSTAPSGKLAITFI